MFLIGRVAPRGSRVNPAGAPPAMTRPVMDDAARRKSPRRVPVLLDHGVPARSAPDIVRDLPRHGHGLSRRTVRDSQRWRLIEGVTVAVAKKGYAGASVADVLAVAGVSRKTFYEHFRDKEHCFLTAYELVSKRLIEALVMTGAAASGPAARRRVQVETFLKALARDPDAARVFMVDVLAAGPRALRAREKVNGRFASVVFGDAPIDPIRRTAIVGGVNNVVAGAIMQGRAKNLLELLDPLSEFVRCALEIEPASQ